MTETRNRTNESTKDLLTASNEKKNTKTHGKPEIVGIEDCPAFLIDNKHLRRGYRKNFRRMTDILGSLCLPHNETLNIWTHLIGSIVALWALIFVMGKQTPYDAIGAVVEKGIASTSSVSHLQQFWAHGSVCPHLDSQSWDASVQQLFKRATDSATHISLSDSRGQQETLDEHVRQDLLAVGCGYLGWVLNSTRQTSLVKEAEIMVFGLADQFKPWRWEFESIKDKLAETVRLRINLVWT